MCLSSQISVHCENLEEATLHITWSENDMTGGAYQTGKNPAFQFVGDIMGSAGRRAVKAELETLAARMNIADRLTFTGDRLDIRDWMAASELVLNLCSDPPEAFGRTVLEAF